MHWIPGTCLHSLLKTSALANTSTALHKQLLHSHPGHWFWLVTGSQQEGWKSSNSPNSRSWVTSWGLLLYYIYYKFITNPTSQRGSDASPNNECRLLWLCGNSQVRYPCWGTKVSETTEQVPVWASNPDFVALFWDQQTVSDKATEAALLFLLSSRQQSLWMSAPLTLSMTM